MVGRLEDTRTRTYVYNWYQFRKIFTPGFLMVVILCRGAEYAGSWDPVSQALFFCQALFVKR